VKASPEALPAPSPPKSLVFMELRRHCVQAMERLEGVGKILRNKDLAAVMAA